MKNDGRMHLLYICVTSVISVTSVTKWLKTIKISNFLQRSLTSYVFGVIFTVSDTSDANDGCIS